MKLFYLILIIVTCISNNIYSQSTLIIGGIPRDTSFTVHSAYTKALKQYPHIKKVFPELPDNIISEEEIAYSQISDTRSLLLNIYRPKDNRKYPALLMVHGGGWSSGNLTLQIPMAMYIASKGYVTIPVEYRLSPETKYPAAVYDLKNAVKWVKANAERYGIDTAKIAISGCSAGGQLAMLTGATNNQPIYENNSSDINTSSYVNAIINIDGISDFSTDELTATRESLSKNKIPAAVKWLGYTYEENKAVWESASPVYHITKDSAPVCFINSSIPRFHGGRDEAIIKLSSLGIYTEVHTIENTPHPFWLFHPWFEETVFYMITFLDKTFK